MSEGKRSGAPFLGRALVASALVVASAVGAGREARAVPPSVELLEDGTELVVTPIVGARTTSFRYLVHAGGTSDPVGLEGLAHLLEHAIFHGNYRTEGERLFQQTRAEGAYLNAFTGPDHTVYVVDGPARAVWSFLPTYLGVLTSPSLDPTRFDVERGVVSAESLLRAGQSSYQLMMYLLLPGLRGQSNVIGTERSRDRVHRPELLAFYREHYRPSNTTIIVTGDVDVPRAKALIAASSLLAPSEPSKAAPQQDLSLNIPAQVRVPAPFYLTLFGFDLAGEDRATCQSLAELMEVRLARAVDVERPLASNLAAACVVLQGRQLLVSLVSSRSYDGAELPDLVEGVFQDARTRTLTAVEREHLVRRAKARIAAFYEDPAALADALVLELGARGPRGARPAALAAVLEPPRLDGVAMRQAAERCFVPQRRIQIDVAPF